MATDAENLPEEPNDDYHDAVSEAAVSGPDVPLPMWMKVVAGVIVAPALVMLAACVYWTALLLGGRTSDMAPEVMLGSILFPAPILLVLLFEQWAVGRRSALAALMMSILLLFPAAIAAVTVSRGVYRLATDRPPNEVASWSQAGGLAVVIALFVVLGAAHLIWWRILVRAQMRQLAEDG
jgi:hypothetical protein